MRAVRLAIASVLMGPVFAFGCRAAVDRDYEDSDAEVPNTIDATALDGTSDPDSSSDTDATQTVDAQTDSASTDGATSDANVDADVDADAVDAGDAGADGDASDGAKTDGAADSSVADTSVPDAAEAGCGPTNTATNCGACGATCDPGGATSSVAACAGNTCVYTCEPGRQDCNNTAPNTNGCECPGTGCCANGCQTAHSTGIGVPYYDCLALGTYNQAQAYKACNAYLASVAAGGGDAGTCAAYGCVSNAGSVVCSTSGSTCHCWKYDPGNSGVNGKVSTTCGCPTSAGATSWN